VLSCQLDHLGFISYILDSLDLPTLMLYMMLDQYYLASISCLSFN
jgi:hypothetical protein